MTKIFFSIEGNPNVQTIDGETPLHIAVIWNRTLIVEMLLVSDRIIYSFIFTFDDFQDAKQCLYFQDHGADISITDNEQNTAINHAITEKHYNLIPTFQNHVFEKKIQKRIAAKNAKMPMISPQQHTPKKAIDKVIKSLECLEINKSPNTEHFLTPNRTNYNFKEASPFLVNINMRPRRKRFEENIVAAKEKLNSKDIDTGTKAYKCDHLETKEAVEIIEISDSDDNCDDQNDTKHDNKLVKNLFELTEENIEKHLAKVIKLRRKDSLINAWRYKVNESRQRKSILPVAKDDIETFLSEHTEKSESHSTGSSQQTIVPAKEKQKQQNHCSETEESFITAPNDDETYVIDREVTAKKDQSIDPENTTAIILQTQEKYEHFDPDDNIVFYENRLLVNPVKSGPKSNTEAADAIVLNTSSESGTCTDLVVPSDYDTDDLRKELKQFGDVPGPITKNTKRLYLKRLVRYKRKPKQTSNNSGHAVKYSKFDFLKKCLENT